jgi:DNA-binding LacI/PurR family transcriptional regulator
MKFEPVTIKDIAKALNLSTSTVSRALRDSYEISAKTKKRVIEYAEEMNYMPNPIALGLKERKTRSIGVVVCEIANSFFSQAINGIESVAYNAGYNVIITQSNESYEREVINVKHLASRSVDGIIISISSETTDFSHLKELRDKGMPIVFFDRIVADIQTHKVTSDNYMGAYNATMHLAQNGYKKIAFLGNAEYLSIIKERLAGYIKALEDSKLPYNPDFIKYCLHGGLIYEETETVLKELLKGKNKPDAIIACADKLTTNCLRYFKKNNVSVPNDVGLIGFSNLDLTEWLQPSLSVIRQQAFEMGANATELLVQLISSKRPVKQFENMVLVPNMIIRESSM